jgi:spore maturation protein CgeB
MRTDGFISNRLFDVVASGGRAISDPVAGIEEIFGDSVRTFDRRSDLEHLLSADPDTVFGPESQRLATARRIAAEHSFDARAARLLAVVLDHRQR